MNYIQLKESVIKLNVCLKVLPDEDKAVLKRLLKKYNQKIKVFSNVDFANEVFTIPEKRSIGTFVVAFRKRKVKPFQDEIERIDQEIQYKSGFTHCNKQLDKVYDRLTLIYDERYSDLRLGWVGNSDNRIKFIEDSKVYQDSCREYDRLCNVYEKQLSKSIEYKEAQFKLGQMQQLLNGFEFNAEIKNHIAMSKLITEPYLRRATFETLTNEAELQFINKTKKVKL